ncbi:(5-formylfuran-3-yl)methyl phosphate synthase [Chelatococcus sp. GCM10030263]|uniref:(5-formylfuran-3-yl)methyl phosphate synthase n=1 Tax=Chelatococcus sp. GCM10030263 TaxID=3273387 RepID=UPI0036121759
MTRLLVSVKDAAEAELAAAAGANLIDAKDPATGALGGLSRGAVEEILRAVAGRRPVSAVVGEHDEPAAAMAAARALAGTGLSFIKIGFGPGLSSEAAVARLKPEGLPPLVAVFFADEDPPFHLLPALAQAGFHGAMLDTRGKRGGGLTTHLARKRLAAFVALCRAHALFCGLAGSLHIADIDRLAPLGADYLGFRGGLCRGGNRLNGLDAEAVRTAAGRLALASTGVPA